MTVAVETVVLEMVAEAKEIDEVVDRGRQVHDLEVEINWFGKQFYLGKEKRGKILKFQGKGNVTTVGQLL